jgi:hypothetical protein
MGCGASSAWCTPVLQIVACTGEVTNPGNVGVLVATVPSGLGPDRLIGLRHNVHGPLMKQYRTTNEGRPSGTWYFTIAVPEDIQAGMKIQVAMDGIAIPIVTAML